MQGRTYLNSILNVNLIVFCTFCVTVVRMSWLVIVKYNVYTILYLEKVLHLCESYVSVKQSLFVSAFRTG